jgi:hypothetical protein
MKQNWEYFEEHSTKYLNKNFQHLEGIIFERSGGSDSTESDIKLKINNTEVFSIESKLSPAQSGQFVVKISNGKFELSKSNKFINPYSTEIIKFLNERFNDYQDVFQSAVEINCPKETITNWIIHHYKSKNSLFIISSTEKDGYCHLSPIDKLGVSFETKVVLRRKKSGSRGVPKSKITEVKNIVELHLKPLVDSFSFKNDDNGSLMVETDIDYSILNRDRYLPGGIFLSVSEPPNSYKVKILSETNNINVIFSIQYIGPHVSSGITPLEDFIKNLKI